MPLRVDVISIFPEVFAPVLGVGMTGRALSRGLLQLNLTDPREFTTDRHRTVDDTPYGGGSGMVMLPEPLVRALGSIEAGQGRGHRILLSPAGGLLDQRAVRRLAGLPHLVLVCGRYEGIDERVNHYVDESISIGDYVLSGGELGALIIIDAVARLLPGVLNNQASAEEESFEEGLLEYPQYTRPAVFEGRAVPEVLLSGNHAHIRRWRRCQSLLRTRARRPDLFGRVQLSPEDERLLLEADRGAAPPAGAECECPS
jgi:tRNA (guanine37-N1)-methyltransferase